MPTRFQLYAAQFPQLEPLRPPAAGRVIRELEPALLECPAQVFLYLGDAPTVFPGRSLTDGDGNTVVIIPIEALPPDGTPVQVLIQTDPDLVPIAIEGLTDADEATGAIRIVIEVPDELIP